MGFALCLCGLAALALARPSSGARCGRAVAPSASHPPALFPSPRLDQDGDGRIAPEERLAINREVPQLILVTISAGASESGLRWLREELGRVGAWGHVTLVTDRQDLADLPGPAREALQQAWEQAAAEGNEVLPAGGAQQPPSGRRPCPEDAPQHDASLRQAMPDVERWPDGGVDLIWPFTTDHPLPSGVTPSRPSAPPGRPRWAVPLADWRLFRQGVGTSCPSQDASLFDEPGCALPPGQQRLQVAQLVANLVAHLRGNRSPFHLGLTARRFAPGHPEERVFLHTLLAEVALLLRSGQNLRFTSIAELLRWLDGGEAPPAGASLVPEDRPRHPRTP